MTCFFLKPSLLVVLCLLFCGGNAAYAQARLIPTDTADRATLRSTKIREKIAALQSRRVQLLFQYRESDPRVRAIDAEARTLTMRLKWPPAQKFYDRKATQPRYRLLHLLK